MCAVGYDALQDDRQAVISEMDAAADGLPGLWQLRLEAAEEVAHAGHLEPRRGARLGALEAA